MLNLSHFFNQIKELKYFVTKIDVPYAPIDFPENYAIGKDIDIIIDKKDYKKIYKIVKIFSKNHINFQQILIKEKYGFRFRFEENNSLHFQIDVKYGNENISDEFLENSLNYRQLKNNYYVTTPLYEVKFREISYNKDNNKKYHLEWINSNKPNYIKDFIWDNHRIKESVINDECYLEGTCHDDRFKNIETPSVEDLYNSMIKINKITEYFDRGSCAVIGNSSILLDSNYGDEIDKHSTIIRCNLGRTKGFEKSVGSRTDFRFIASKSFNRVEIPTHENYDFGFFPSLKNEHFFVRYDHPNTKALIGGMINNMNGNNFIHYLIPEFIKKCDELKNGYSSIGFIASIFASCFFNKVSLYGFNFFKEGVENSHYFEKVKSEASAGHNFDSEENVLSRIENIKIFK